jgi:hypothetical protein
MLIQWSTGSCLNLRRRDSGGRLPPGLRLRHIGPGRTGRVACLVGFGLLVRSCAHGKATVAVLTRNAFGWNWVSVLAVAAE